MGLCFMRNQNPIIDVRIFLSPRFEYVTQPPEPRLLRCRISEIFVPLKKKKKSKPLCRKSDLAADQFAGGLLSRSGGRTDKVESDMESKVRVPSSGLSACHLPIDAIDGADGFTSIAATVAISWAEGAAWALSAGGGVH